MLFNTRRKVYHAAKLALWEVGTLIRNYELIERSSNFDRAQKALYDFQKVFEINAIEYSPRLFYENKDTPELISCFLNKSLFEYTDNGNERSISEWSGHWKIVEETILRICDHLRNEYENELLLHRRLASRR